MSQAAAADTATQTDRAASPQAVLAPDKPRFKFDNRWLAPILITSILVVGQLTAGILEPSHTGTFLDFLPLKTLTAIGTCLALEMILGKLLIGRFPHLASAYISGISVGILIRSPYYWPYALCAAITIVSKYAIRYRGRHLWNPSNFGVSAMLFLAPFAVASLSIQWDNRLYAMVIVWLLGCMILYKVGRLHVTLSYVTAFLVLAYVRTLITGDNYWAEIAPLTGPMYQLFIFFMITDPKTSVTGRWAQSAVAVLVALVETGLRLLPNYAGAVGLTDAQAVSVAVHAPYFALFLVGPITNFIDLQLHPPKPQPAAAAPAVASQPS